MEMPSRARRSSERQRSDSDLFRINFYLDYLMFRLRYLICLMAAVAGCTALPATGANPNILVILVDDAGYRDFGFMGCEDIPTPRIDALAAQGTILTDAHVTATVCSPSRAGLMTGRYQQRFGHENNVPPDDEGMDPSQSTMGDWMRQAGYRTYCVGKWHLGNRTMYHPVNRGFDEFYGFLEGGRSYFPDPLVDHPENYRALLHNRRQVPFEGYLTDVFTGKALEYMKKASGQPWFIYLSYNAVHSPMEAKAEHLEKFAGHPRQKLAAMTWSLDENVGRITDYLKSSNQLENTLIFFLSDNGGAGAHNNQSDNSPLKGWKGNKYEGGHRVPFFVVWPGVVPSDGRFEGLASALDILPTSLAAAGYPEPADGMLDGVDLLPFLKGLRIGDPHRELFWRKDRMAAMRAGPYKLIRLEGFGYRLYHLGEDLREARDLRTRRVEQFEHMRERLIAWDREMAAPFWYEDEEWNTVTYEIHRALMENEEPRYKNPVQMHHYHESEDPQ